MIKSFIKRLRFNMWVNSMDRILKKAEHRYESWDNKYFNDLELFHIVYTIDDHIESCQEALEALREKGARIFKND